jgi:APA family basic amino acid/polyamine antiporter
MLMGQSRVFFSMSKDGLIPKVFSSVHPKFRTPANNQLLFMLFVSLFAAFVPARVVGEMTSIGTLFAFILVCVGIIVMRKNMPDIPRAFKTPMVPLVPILGIFTCLFMMVFLPADTWIRLILWMLIGMDVYWFYGIRKSILGDGTQERVGISYFHLTGLVMGILLFIMGFVHQHIADTDAAAKGEVADKSLFYISLIFGAIHAVYFAMQAMRKK